MKFIRLTSFYNKNGNFHQGKEYTVCLGTDNARLYANGVSRALNSRQTAELRRQILQLDLSSTPSLQSRPGMPQLMKWELTCSDANDNTLTATGFNSTPHSLSRFIKIISFFMNDYEPRSDRLHKAVRFATDAHTGQTRKGSDVPYIVHPMEVLRLLTDMNADDNLQIAGVLHDVVEDTPVTIQQVEAEFGKEVARLVASHTEEEGKSWREQKRATVEIVKKADKPVQMLIMADKISNLKSMLYDYIDKGEELWKRFGSTKEMQAWHNNRLIAALSPLRYDADTRSHYNDMKNLFLDLYADFYVDYEKGELYEHITGIETHRYSRIANKWETVTEIPSDTEKITRTKAEKLIELWTENIQNNK